MNPKFIERIHLNIPKPLIPKIDDFDKTVVQITNNAVIKTVEQIDDAIFNEIVDIARCEGIDDVYLLDKKNILSALEKQIPKKPIKIDETYNVERGEWVADYECPSCGNPYADDSYCSCCGQALEWGDGE